MLTSLVALVACISIIIPQTYLGQQLFHFVPLKSIYLLWIAAIVLVYFIVTDVVKVLYYRMYNGKKV